MKKVQCSLCGSINTKFLLESFNVHGRHLLDKKKVFRIFRCLECENIFVGGVEVNDKYYKRYYSLNYYGGGQSYESLIKRILNLLGGFSLKRKQGFILKNIQLDGEKCRLLDIGCGEGNFLSGLDSSKFKKYGIEINKKGYEACLTKNLKVYNQELADIDFKGMKFDVVTLWHVMQSVP